MIFSDRQLLDFKRCPRRAHLDATRDRPRPESEFLQKLRRENQRQIERHLADKAHCKPASRDPAARAAETLELMQAGVERIARGLLWLPDASAIFPERLDLAATAAPTLLCKQPGRSRFGPWLYVPADIKLGRRPKPEYKAVAAFQALVLAEIQGVPPPRARLILRDERDYAVDLALWLERARATARDCLAAIATPDPPELFISRQRCHLCHWYDHCYTRARAEEHLSLLPGVTPARYAELQALGLTDVERIATAPLGDRLDANIGTDVAAQLQLQARAVWLQQPQLKSLPPLNDLPDAPVELYFDIEAEPERDLDYLFGVLVVTPDSERFVAFLAETPEDERAAWEAFLAFVERYPRAPIYHYSPYETDAIARLARRYATPRARAEPVLARCLDLHRTVTRAVTLPVESYSLKALAQWLGFTWRDPEASGEQSVCWYDRWLHGGDRALLAAICRYNEDDCRATYRLKTWLDAYRRDLARTPAPLA